MTTRTLVIAFAGVAMVTAAGCGTSGTPNATTSQPTTATSSPTPAATSSIPPSPVAAASPACDDLGGAVGPDQFCTVHADTSDHTIDMRFPVDYPDQQAVVDALTRLRDGFVDQIGDQPPRNAPYALDISGTEYRSGPPDARTASLVFEEYINTGGAHPETYYDALNYDMATQAPITFDTLFAPDTNPVEVLDPIVQAELAKRVGGDAEPNTLGARAYQNFAITDDAVIFFIGQGTWLVEAAGPQEVSVPRSDIASILA